MALRLLAMAQAGPLDEPGQARAELLYAQTAVHPDRGLLLLKAAERLEPLDAGLAREAYRDAFDAALTAGRLDGGMRRVAEAVRAAPPGPAPPGPAPTRVSDALLAGLAALVIEGPAAGAPLLAAALRAARAEPAGATGDADALRWLPFACRMSQVAWDDESWAALSARQIDAARQAGALTVLPAALAAGVAFRLGTGELAVAVSMAQEAAAIARAAGDQADPQGPALIAAWRGQEAEAGRLIAAATTEMVARGEGQWLTAAVWATAVLYNGLGRYDEALATAERVGEDPGELGLAAWALAELIEAAARTGAPERAAGALRRLTEITGAAAAIYQAASPRQRHDVHRALAQATDPEVNPDRRAWHLGHATPGLDEDVAAGLERAARRTRARGALAAAAVLSERAAELTPGPARRASRALHAAQAHHDAGAPDVALRLLAMAQAGPLDEPGQARAELLYAQTAVHPDRGLLLLKAAERLEPLDAGLAREAYRDAFDAALTAGRLDGGMRRVAEAVRAAPPGPAPPGPAPTRVSDALLAGLAALVIEGPAAGAPLLAAALRAARAEPAGATGDADALRWLPFACRMSQVAWDDESWAALSARQIDAARQAGALTVLPAALAAGVAFRLGTGELAVAVSMAQEAAAIARAAGDQADPQGPALIAAWRGQEAEAGRLIAAATTEMVARGEGQWLTAAVWATAVLYNGLGRYDEALATAERVGEDPGELGLAAWALAELIEAAARTGAPERAAGALRRLTEITGAAATDWALGILARSRALMNDGEPEPLYLEAIERLGRTRIRAELARAHLLYGEWLRRHGRRSAAREQLRTAREMLDAMGIAAFAERARRELVATGETARKRSTVTADKLTAQETQIAMLASHGHSNPEISTQLFISPRTVEWHLRKVFGKLGISSRKELRTALPDLGQVPLSA